MSLELDLNDTGDLVLSNTNGKVFATFSIEDIWELMLEDPNWLGRIDQYAECIKEIVIDKHKAQFEVIGRALKGRKSKIKYSNRRKHDSK